MATAQACVNASGLIEIIAVAEEAADERFDEVYHADIMGRNGISMKGIIKGMGELLRTMGRLSTRDRSHELASFPIYIPPYATPSRY